MLLHDFRKHLADELARLPTEPEQGFESYAVTTAALARQVMAYLDIDDLAVPNKFNDDPPEYPLQEALNRIVHFRVLNPDALTFSYPGKPDLVTLYSDHTQDREEHQYIRLNEYVEVVGRLANDDPYVASHLFRRAVTQMYKVMNATDEPDAPREGARQAEFRKQVSRMVGNAWNMLDQLVESGEVTPVCALRAMFSDGRGVARADRCRTERPGHDVFDAGCHGVRCGLSHARTPLTRLVRCAAALPANAGARWKLRQSAFRFPGFRR